MTVRTNIALIASLTILAVGHAGAQTPAADTAKNPHAAQPERPTVATHAGTVAPGWFEIETGVERDRFGPAATGTITPTVLKFGIADRAQLSIFGTTAKPPGEATGLGDVGVGVKWRLVEDAPIVGDFAIFPAVKFPTGSETTGAGTGTTDASLLLISSHDLGGVAMDLNVGYTRRSGDGSSVPRDALLWTASFGGSLLGNLGWVAECFGYPRTSGPAGQPSIVALLAGPTYQIREWLVVDAGIIVPVTGPQPHALYTGVVYNIAQLWGPRPGR